ncbi:D-mannose-1-phosphate guanyltransferase, partial [Bacteroidales bacterium OttesenSCG-928-C03]|nr:D-mannose-1-phosphate guanyltransferase [Bacteroidales bacterium OttesenSCG-928-C03]
REIDPLGTGGAIKFAFSKCEQNDVLVLNGDTLFNIDLDDFFTFYKEKNTNLAIALRQVNDVSRYGSVKTDASGRIIQFVEKNRESGSGFINGGVYYLNKQLVQVMPEKDNFSFEKEVMEKYCHKQKYYGCPSNGYFIDIGIPEDYARAQVELPELR